MLTWRCDRSLIYPPFADAVDALFASGPHPFFAISGHRSLDEQAKLYTAYQAGGPRAAPPGKSAHNFGTAIDVALDLDGTRPGLQPGYDIRHPGWAWLAKVLPGNHATLKHGRTFADWPHIEWRRWKEITRRAA